MSVLLDLNPLLHLVIVHHFHIFPTLCLAIPTMLPELGLKVSWCDESFYYAYWSKMLALVCIWSKNTNFWHTNSIPWTTLRRSFLRFIRLDANTLMTFISIWYTYIIRLVLRPIPQNFRSMFSLKNWRAVYFHWKKR